MPSTISSPKTADDATGETGYYLRVWKRNPQGDWRLEFEVQNPLRPVTK